MNNHPWLWAFLATFTAGVVVMATLPPIDSGPQLFAGWTLWIVSFICLSQGLPEEHDDVQ